MLGAALGGGAGYGCGINRSQCRPTLRL